LRIEGASLSSAESWIRVLRTVLQVHGEPQEDDGGARGHVLWGATWAALAARATDRRESVIEVVRGLSSAWHGVGRVVFHLAQNNRNAVHPFAFLATYTTRLSRVGKAQHVPS
jgi:hypothetical protein